MRWALYIGGGLVALTILVTLIGMILPRDHVASTTATIEAAPNAVWHAISDVASAATWRDLQKVEIVNPGPPLRWKELSKFGPITYEQVESTVPTKFVSRIADTGQGFGGTWTFVLAPAGDGTKVTITENGFVSNPIFRFMSRFVFGYYGTQEAYLRALGKKFGHDVTPARG
jgi:hypothetical protein